MRPRHEVAQDIVGDLVRRHSTVAVLLHHAVAERLELGPTDHKCLDLLRDRGAMTGSELAAITGLTTGAITGVVTRLERAGWLRRAPHPRDGRKQVLSPAEASPRDLQGLFAPIRKDLARVLGRFDARQLVAIADFLAAITDVTHRHIALLRAESRAPARLEATPRKPSRPTRRRVAR